MKNNKYNVSDEQPETQLQFPFQHLLPSLPTDGLTPEHFKTLAERLRRAVAASMDGVTLSEEEARNFREKL